MGCFFGGFSTCQKMLNRTLERGLRDTKLKALIYLKHQMNAPHPLAPSPKGEGKLIKVPLPLWERV